MSGTPISRGLTYMSHKNAVIDSQSLSKIDQLENSSFSSTPVKKKKFSCNPCSIPLFILQLIFSIPSFIGCVVSVIVVILMSTVIVLFSIQSRAAVGDVSLSVRDMSISTVNAHLNTLFDPLVKLTLAFREFRIANSFSNIFGDKEEFVKFMTAVRAQYKGVTFCGDDSYFNAIGFNNINALFNDAEIWTIQYTGSGTKSWLQVEQFLDNGTAGPISIPFGAFEVDNYGTPYVQAVMEHGWSMSRFTPPSRDQLSNDFYNSFVSSFSVNGTNQYCWNSLSFGNTVSDYLRSNQRFPNSMMFLVERDGSVVASSDVSRVPNVIMPGQLRFKLDEASDKEIAEAFADVKKATSLNSISTIFRHEYGSFFIDIQPYYGPVSGIEGIDWLVVMYTPQSDILGKVTSSQNLSLGISIGVLVFGLLLAYFTSFCITLPLFQIKNELQRVSRLQLNPRSSLVCQISFLSEIRSLSTATSKLKSGLQSFERYVPSSVVKMILQENRAAELGMKPFTLTALFSDIVNFTNIAEKEEPQSLVDQLEIYFTLFNKKLQAHGLSLISYIGDAVFAFATHKDSPLHALKSCLCACEMQSGLAPLNDAWISSGKPALYTRIGVHTGEALVGNIGSFDRFSFTAIGDTINLASRLEAINKVYHTSTCISEFTRDHVLASNQPDINLVFVPMDLVAVKGKEARVTIYNLCTNLEKAMPKGLEPTEEVISLYENVIEAYKGKDFELAEKLLEGAGSEISEDPRLAPILEKIKLHLSGTATEDIDQMTSK